MWIHFFIKPSLVESWIQLMCDETHRRFQFWPAHAPLLLFWNAQAVISPTEHFLQIKQLIVRVSKLTGCSLSPFLCHSRTCLQLPTALSCLTTGPPRQAHSAHVPAWPFPVPIPTEVPGAPQLPCPGSGTLAGHIHRSPWLWLWTENWRKLHEKAFYKSSAFKLMKYSL